LPIVLLSEIPDRQQQKAHQHSILKVIAERRLRPLAKKTFSFLL
jgi:hypothetical protein